jgi:uncharacterized protein (UPF0548 family)
MFSLRRPSAADIERFLREQGQCNFTYAAVGATAGQPPAGFVVDHTRVTLGQGEQVFRSAVAALRNWQQFRLGWLEPIPAGDRIEPGATVAVLARCGGLWCLNACRIIHVIDEPARFGFAYGTLPDHIESGEERFLIEWDQAGGAVSYDILAFSRPRHLLAKLGYPFVRRQQRRFGRDSAAAMRAAVATG